MKQAEAPTEPIWSGDPLPDIRSLDARTTVVLDDDPTGTQTVRDVLVLTRWNQEDLRAVLADGRPLVYLLTNSRSLSSTGARELAVSIGRELRDAEAAVGRSWSIISRGDSTLRGHFPVEVDALAEGLGRPAAKVLLAPFLGDAGRVTLGGVHYVRRDGMLLAVGETEYARDPVFGYRASDLREWVAERVAATGSTPRVTRLVRLDELRSAGPAAVRDALVALPPRGVLVTDALEERDIEVVALGALEAERVGVPLLARTAASFVRARGALDKVEPLAPTSLSAGTPGLVVVGSHVPVTTSQLNELVEDPPIPIEPLEVDVGALVDGLDVPEEVAIRVARSAVRAMDAGRTPVVHTSRSLVRDSHGEQDLRIAALVSHTLVRCVALVDRRPAWVIAKGGITSSDVATKALGVTQAWVMGPVIPGVPVWRLTRGARWADVPYVVFPGNVGGPTDLRRVVAALSGVAT